MKTGRDAGFRACDAAAADRAIRKCGTVIHMVESEQHVCKDGPCAICAEPEPWQSKQDMGKPWHYLLLDELPAPVLALNFQGNVAFWNRKCEEITGYASTEIVCNPCAREMLWPNPTCREHVVRQWSGSRDFECTLTCRGGQIKHIRWHPMSDRFPICGWSGWAIGSDVTDLRVLERAQWQNRCSQAAPDMLPDPVVVMDLDGRIEHANRQFLEEFGHTVEEVHGKTTADLGILSDVTFQQLKREVLPKLISDGVLVNIETAAQRPDGNWFPILLSYRLLRGASGEPQAIACSSRDITLVKQAFEATAEKERVLQALFHAIPESLLIADTEGRILACNETAAERVGRPVREVVGRLAVDCLTDDASSGAREQYMARIAEVFHSGEPVCFTDVQGGLVLQYTLYPVVDDKGQVTGVAIFARDMTRQVQTQKELHEYYERLRGAKQLASLGTIITTLTSELAHPLSIVRLADQTALAELKKLNCPDDAIQQDLEASIAASAAMSAIVSRFRSYARQSAKTKETNVHIDRVAECTIRLLEQSARQARVTFQTDNLDALPAIHMRENELEQVFFALTQNAVHAADGAKDRYLLITGVSRDDEIELRFEDNCGGIEPANLLRFFEPFFTTKPPGQGIGLGLFVARQIVQRRGGQISVQNRHGQGVTFVVTLPVN